jgi:tetratricopeptide (TPR) repeat protein
MLESEWGGVPQEPSIHRALAESRRVQGDELGAQAHLIAAQTLEAHAGGTRVGSLTELCKVASGYFMLGDHAAAERWYRLVLTLDPNLAIAHQNLAAIHSSRGEVEQAEACRQRAYAIQRVFIEPADAPVRRLLILCAGRTSGNVPIETLLSSGQSDRIKYVIDYAAEEEDAQLPPFDLVFNAIGEPDVAARLADRLDRFATQCGRPLLNASAAVGRTQRHRLAALLGDLDGVKVAACSRHDDPPASRADLVERLFLGGLELPALARPTASHGGEGLVRCDSLEALESALCSIDGAHYLTAFHDLRSPDGYCRKYRIVFVDRQPFAYHLAISTHWMVHYFSADMVDHPWKIDEERRFLEDPAAVLGERATAAVLAVGRRLDLDYAGIDFTLLADGQVFVFEANATMLVHPERSNGALAHRNVHVQRIVDAFERLQRRRMAVGS